MRRILAILEHAVIPALIMRLLNGRYLKKRRLHFVIMIHGDDTATQQVDTCRSTTNHAGPTVPGRYRIGFSGLRAA